MSASYDPPEVPEFDPDDFEYITTSVTAPQIYEWQTYIMEASSRRMIKKVMTKYEDNAEETKKYLTYIVCICPENISALRAVLAEYFPQHLKFVEQLSMLQ